MRALPAAELARARAYIPYSISQAIRRYTRSINRTLVNPLSVCIIAVYLMKRANRAWKTTPPRFAQHPQCSVVISRKALRDFIPFSASSSNLFTWNVFFFFWNATGFRGSILLEARKVSQNWRPSSDSIFVIKTRRISSAYAWEKSRSDDHSPGPFRGFPVARQSRARDEGKFRWDRSLRASRIYVNVTLRKKKGNSPGESPVCLALREQRGSMALHCKKITDWKFRQGYTLFFSGTIVDISSYSCLKTHFFSKFLAVCLIISISEIIFRTPGSENLSEFSGNCLRRENRKCRTCSRYESFKSGTFSFKQSYCIPIFARRIETSQEISARKIFRK